MPHRRPLEGRKRWFIFGLTLAIVVLAIAVPFAIIHLSAAPNTASFEAEGGTVISPATKITAANASGGSAVQFVPASSGGGLTYTQVQKMVTDHLAANTGYDTDINRPPGNARPGAAELRAVCGTGWVSIYPQLAWEYGGSNHMWIKPAKSPLLICVHGPINPPYTADWKYTKASDHVEAMVFIKFVAQSPCGEDLTACMVADTTNYEIFVDEASGGWTNGKNVGLDLQNSTTDLYLRHSDGTVVHLWTNV